MPWVAYKSPINERWVHSSAFPDEYRSISEAWDVIRPRTDVESRKRYMVVLDKPPTREEIRMGKDYYNEPRYFIEYWDENTQRWWPSKTFPNSYTEQEARERITDRFKAGKGNTPRYRIVRVETIDREDYQPKTELIKLRGEVEGLEGARLRLDKATGMATVTLGCGDEVTFSPTALIEAINTLRKRNGSVGRWELRQ